MLIIILAALFVAWTFSDSSLNVITKNANESHSIYQTLSLNIDSISLSENKNETAYYRTKTSKNISDWFIKSGKWRLINETYLVGENANFGDGLTSRNSKFKNQIIEFNIKPKDDIQKNFFLFLVYFRYKDINNFYYIDGLYDGRGAGNANLVHLVKSVDSIGTIITSSDMKQAWQPNKWYKIKVVVNDEFIQMYVDGNKLIERKEVDPNLGEGAISFMTYSSSADFSDITITQLTNQTLNLILNTHMNAGSNISITPFLIEKYKQPSGVIAYRNLYSFSSKNYSLDLKQNNKNEILNLSFSANLIRPPDIIYFPTEPYNRTFAIRLIARGWDEQKQEWVFKEFMSPEFTWEDVVEGRTITAGGNSTG